jgi:hypothetical protein
MSRKDKKKDKHEFKLEPENVPPTPPPDDLSTSGPTFFNQLDRIEKGVNTNTRMLADVLEELEEIENGVDANTSMLKVTLVKLEEIDSLLEKIIVLLTRATSGTITQGDSMEIIGVVQGSSGNFTVTWNGGMQAGQVTAWTADDTTVTLTPNGDKVTAAVPPADAVGQFTLLATGKNSDGNTVTAMATIPILLAPPPAATGGEISQVS